MKIRANRFDVNKLFVLGAGASYAASFTKYSKGRKTRFRSPLDNEFTTRISKIDLTKPYWVKEAVEIVETKFRANGKFSSYNLEEAIIQQLNILELYRSLHPTRSSKQINPTKWLNNLSHLICIVLKRTRENKDQLYYQFAEKYFSEDSEIDDLKDRIITFNYDTLLDKHLIKNREIDQLYFSEIRKKRNIKSKGTFRHPLMLKLHGSVNWRCYEDDFKAIIGDSELNKKRYKIETIWVDDSATPTPKDEIYPLIMPPLPAKRITSIEIFNWLWTKAYEYLHEAKELIIIGYSLPPTDKVAETMFSTFNGSNLTRVVLVDPSTIVLDRWRKVLSRSGLSKLRWTYYGSFKDYCDNELS